MASTQVSESIPQQPLASSSEGVKQRSQNKIQNKIVNFMEEAGGYKSKRDEFILLNKEYHALPKEQKPQDVVETVTRQIKCADGNCVSVTQQVKKKQFPSEKGRELYEKMKAVRKGTIRYNRTATLYINMLVDKMIEDFISACEPTNSKKTNEKTYGWKQFNVNRFSKTFTYSLVLNSRYFTDFVVVKNLLSGFVAERELERLKDRLTKAEMKTVLQDLSLYRQIVTREQGKPDDEVQKVLLEEFGDKWCVKLGSIHSILDHIQSEDDDSKLLFNNVKNATKEYQESHADPAGGAKIKISNGFKNMVSKIIRQFLKSLQFKVDVYLGGSSNQVKHTDIKKVIQLSASLDSLDELKAQFDAFDLAVKKRVQDIEAARQLSKAKPTPALAVTASTPPQ